MSKQEVRKGLDMTEEQETNWLTALDIAVALLSEKRGVDLSEQTSFSGDDLAEVGIPILGGCSVCGATLGAYNATPQRSGYWACHSCARSGYETIAQWKADYPDDESIGPASDATSDDGDTEPGGWYLVETMPASLRESHRAAGNWGDYPHNGAERFLTACPEVYCDGDEYNHRVRPALDSDWRDYPRAEGEGSEIAAVIAQTGGYILSEGTLRNRDLLPRMLAALEDLVPTAYEGFSERERIESADADDPWWESEEGGWASEALFARLNEYAPEGFYFGANEGDGACFGFWASECESEEGEAEQEESEPWRAIVQEHAGAEHRGRVFVADGEALTDAQREEMVARFGAPVADSYMGDTFGWFVPAVDFDVDSGEK